MVFSPLRRGASSVRLSSNARSFARVLLPLTCLLSSSLLGCDDEDDSDGRPGELGSNHFFYGCANPADDVQCREDLDSFPDFIAVGARFELNARHNSSSLFVKPASSVLVSSASGEFRFLRPGFSAFLALDSRDELKDFVHLEAIPVDEIQVEGSFGQHVTEVTLPAGRTMTLVAVPLGDGEELAGSLSFRWATDDERVVRVPRRGTEIRLEALREGSALLRVELDEVETTIRVTVTEGTVIPSDAGTALDAGTGQTSPDASPLDASTDATDASAPSNDGGPNDAGTSTSSAATSSSEPSGADASTPADASPDAEAQTEAGAQ